MRGLQKRIWEELQIPVSMGIATNKLVAQIASKLRKPLAARLFPVPGKAAGERAHYDDPYLTDCVVMKAE